MDYNRLIETTKYWYGNTTAASHSHSFDVTPTPYVADWPSYTATFWRTQAEIAANIENINKQKEDQMTTLDKVHRERTEAAERARIERQYQAFDALELDRKPEGTVIVFDVEGEHTRTYAALRADGRWWVTGGSSPNGVGLEDLLAWMIRKDIDPTEVIEK